MAQWLLPQYGTIPFIVGIAIAGNVLVIHQIDAHLVMSDGLRFEMTDLESRIKAVCAAVNLGRLLEHFKINNMVKPTSRPKYQRIERSNERGYVQLNEDHVSKCYLSVGRWLSWLADVGFCFDIYHTYKMSGKSCVTTHTHTHTATGL